jgi:hypothetical protein
MKIRPVEADLFFAEGQTDMTTLIVFFAILRTRLKICWHNSGIAGGGGALALAAICAWGSRDVK